MSEPLPPLWILKAIAGKANAVAWPDAFQCKFIARTVTTPMYPLEVYEEMAASGTVLEGRMQGIIEDQYQTSIVLTEGTIVQTRAYVYAKQEPDHYQTSIVLTRGDIFAVRNFVNAKQAPDHYQTSIVLTSGTISGGVLARMPTDEITSTATVTGGTLT